MKKEEIIEKVINHVKEKLSGEGTGHDWWHITRVVNLAKQIASEEKGVDIFVVELAALLHDIADWKFTNGDENKGPDEAKQLLQSLQIEEAVINNVTEIIRDMGFKGGIEQKKLSKEGMIVQDADRLDAIGAIGIARCFAYGGSKGREIYNPHIPPQEYKTKEEYLHSQTPSINHFYEKLLKLKDLMNTQTGKKLAQQRHLFMETFLEEFYNEWEGKK